MATYSKCPPTVDAIVRRIIAANHPELLECKVTIGPLFAFAPRDKNGMPTGPAVKLNGYPCAAVVRITPLKRRVQGLADAEIVIDGDNWKDWSDARQDALIDHELCHLELARDKGGAVILDDHFRPKLRMKLHDWQLGGFAAVIQRHGEESFDALTFQEAVATHRQLLMPFMGDVSTGRNLKLA